LLWIYLVQGRGLPWNLVKLFLILARRVLLDLSLLFGLGMETLHEVVHDVSVCELGLLLVSLLLPSVLGLLRILHLRRIGFRHIWRGDFLGCLFILLSILLPWVLLRRLGRLPLLGRVWLPSSALSPSLRWVDVFMTRGGGGNI
jgi:hypothetical protein